MEESVTLVERDGQYFCSCHLLPVKLMSRQVLYLEGCPTQGVADIREVLKRILEHAPESCGDPECQCVHYRAALRDARRIIGT